MRSKAQNICEQFLPDQKVVIAGGYAARSYSAKDLDLWVLGMEAEEVEPLRSFIKAKADGFYHSSSEWEDYNMGIFDLGILYFKNFKLPVHIMGFSGDVNELLALFDISTHVVAQDPYTEERFEMEWTTTPSEHPKIVEGSIPAPDSTLERYVRICRRYHHIPDAVTITKLLKLWKEGV